VTPSQIRIWKKAAKKPVAAYEYYDHHSLEAQRKKK